LRRTFEVYFIVKKYWLKDFEVHISSSVLAQAQAVVQAGQVTNLREIERHFWVALVEDREERYETEVMLTPHKIKAYACECRTEPGTRLMCFHTAATLLKLRQFLAQKLLDRQTRAQQLAAAQAEKARLTVQTVLNVATPEALVDFIRQYARQDRDFALSLKTHFVGLVEGVANPYAQVIDGALPKTGGVIREQDFRRLRSTLDGLKGQLETAVVQQQHRIVLLLSTTILDKTGPLCERLDEPRRSVLVDFCEHAFNVLAQLHTQALAPELQEELWPGLLKLAAKAAFPVSIWREAAQLLARNAVGSARFDQLYALYDQALSPPPVFTLYLLLSAYAQRGLPEAVVRLLADYETQPQLLKEAILHLYYSDYWAAALAAAEHFLLQNRFHAGQRRELEEIIGLAAEKSGDQARYWQYLQKRFIQSGDTEWLRRLKTAVGGQWPRTYAELHVALTAANRRDLLPAVAALADDQDALEALLAESELALLEQYQSQLRPQFAYKRYLTLLSQHLQEHFGKPGSAYVRGALERLLAKGETALAKELVQALTQRFPERSTLPEELEEIF
jgi:hypothetical protein